MAEASDTKEDDRANSWSQAHALRPPASPPCDRSSVTGTPSGPQIPASAGANRRLSRLFDPDSGRTVLLPIDQPVTLGPLPGIASLDAALDTLLKARPDGLIAHRGVLRRLPPQLARNTALLLHLSAGTALGERPWQKVLTGAVDDALALAADAVSLQVTFGTAAESAMLQDLADTVRRCERVGLPVLTMVYVFGHDPVERPATVAHAARVVAEMGSDIVKVPWTGSAESFAAVVEGCFVPVVVAGGERSNFAQVVSTVSDAVRVGAAGACIGRNVYQHERPAEALETLRQIVHGHSRNE